MLMPTPDGTEATVAVDSDAVRELLEAGVKLGDIVIPRTTPHNVSQLALFAD